MAEIKNFAMRELRERPILFSGPMVRAIIDGRKTQTRRVLNPNGGAARYLATDEASARVEMRRLSPYGQPGDRLYVRETWQEDADWCLRVWYQADGASRSRGYRADDRWMDDVPPPSTPPSTRWKPSIHMPREYSRLTLEITEVRVERLQEISEEDAAAEGVTLSKALMDLAYSPQLRSWVVPDKRSASLVQVPGIRGAFASLWDDLNASRGFGWDANPWVWCIGFKRRDSLP